MRKVWWITDTIVSPLGFTTEENFFGVVQGRTGVSIENSAGNKPVCIAICKTLEKKAGSTQFELLCERALDDLARQVAIPSSKTLFILSTTKGNIEVIEKNQPDHPRLPLHLVSKYLSHRVGITDNIVVSNACTSGVVALLLAKRQIESGAYDHAVVLGADAVSKFVVSGFQSLNALSDSPCKPFDVARNGINLGEAASAVFISAHPDWFSAQQGILITGGAITNDANHISGPSKTGEELAIAIKQTLHQAGKGPAEIDFVSAHGTATLYNDEMESKAFHLVGLSETPLHSLKANFGHTLGAAGVLESVLSVSSLRHQQLLPSRGFEILGVSKPVNVIKQSEHCHIKNALKTSSGFGGCNSAILFQFES